MQVLILCINIWFTRIVCPLFVHSEKKRKISWLSNPNLVFLSFWCNYEVMVENPEKSRIYMKLVIMMKERSRHNVIYKTLQSVIIVNISYKAKRILVNKSHLSWKLENKEVLFDPKKSSKFSSLRNRWFVL